MKYFLLTILILFELGSLSAQSFVGKLNPFPLANADNSAAVDTLKIIAVMVEFQQDADGTTSGNGKFGSIYTQNYGNDILDPLPHDQTYFETHLEFVKNYFAKVSNGQLTIQYTVLPDTFSVSDRMRNYSPPPGSDDFTPIADFSVETWTKADQLYPDTNFAKYDVFLIFHAGVGRDISLPGSIGNERDLPSVYLSDKAFKEIYGETFEGIPVSGGSFNISNSMIIPETESRELETISGNFLFEITINGLICASIGSHLGLPDLFDTETGLSAIGRFGLMDGQSIFAYLGTYPPEPSPWSKIKLGWAEAVTLDIQNADVSIITDVVATISDTVILKVPLNSTEYYLIENRQRDANKDGSIVTYVNNGSVLTKTFLKDTTGYYSFSVDSLSGVIINVDEFDWAVPGNGIVIWHIDENVINEKIADNEVNTDKNRRGVDVEEADGVQDIGERFFTIFGDEVIGEGFEEDFWYAANPSELFQNRFAKDTRPNTRTNTGANSLITMKNFSEIANTMSFRVEFGDSVIKPLFALDLNSDGISNALSVLTDDFGETGYYALVNSDLNVVDEGLNISEVDSFSNFKMSGTVQNNVQRSYGAIGTKLNTGIATSGSFELTVNETQAPLTAPPLVYTNEQGIEELVLGTANGYILFYEISNNPVLLDSMNVAGTMDVVRIAGDGNFLAFIAYHPDVSGQVPWVYIDDSGMYVFEIGEIPKQIVVTQNGSGDYLSIVLTDQNRFYGLQGDNKLFEFRTNLSNETHTFSITDLKQDGNNYIVINNGIYIEVYNLTGVLADNFPFTDPLGIGFTGTPLTADFEGDSNSEIISVTKDGRIFAIDGGTGNVVSDFPISCGSGITATPSLYNANGVTNLAVLNDQNILSAWSISSVEGTLYWSEEYGNPQNTAFIPAAENTNRINEFFPTSKAYNYPNPVYEGTTNIRYYVSENASINIKIFDLAGDYVAELNDEAQGGVDNETVWDVSNIQSGIYLARIEASSNNGQTEQAIIKIAVVK